MGKYIKNVMKEIADSYGWRIVAQGMETDHYHMQICVQPRWSIPKIVEKLKSNSAKGIFRRFPDVKNRLWGGEFWADGYCVTTVGREMNTDQIQKYIAEQDITIKL